jgi:ribokinase
VLNGAGSDTFTGAYASDYLRQKAAGAWDIRSAVVRANKAAAITIMKMEAQAGIPWANEVDQFYAPFLDPDISILTSTTEGIGLKWN